MKILYLYIIVILVVLYFYHGLQWLLLFCQIVGKKEEILFAKKEIFDISPISYEKKNIGRKVFQCNSKSTNFIIRNEHFITLNKIFHLLD